MKGSDKVGHCKLTLIVIHIRLNLHVKQQCSSSQILYIWLKKKQYLKVRFVLLNLFFKYLTSTFMIKQFCSWRKMQQHEIVSHVRFYSYEFK